MESTFTLFRFMCHFGISKISIFYSTMKKALQLFCIIQSNQRTEILSWNSVDLTSTHCLRFHTRAVSDLNWHHFEPTLLASCSVDTYINIWDFRDTRKPCVSLSAVGTINRLKLILIKILSVPEKLFCYSWSYSSAVEPC